MQAHDPFQAIQNPKRANARRSKIHVGDLEIANDPVPEKRQLISQYDPLFEQMKVGQCIKVEPERVGTVGNALRNWIHRNRKRGITVKCVSKYPGCKDKLGRIWLIEKPKDTKNNKPA